MLRDTAVQLVRDELGYNNGLAAEIILRRMDSVQYELETGSATLPLPWFMFDPIYYQDTVVGDTTYRFFPGMVGYDEEWKFYTLDGDTKYFLRRMAYHEFAEDELTPGRPKYWDLGGNSVNIGPAPDAVYRLYMPSYWRTTPISEVATDVVSPWLEYFPHLIIAETAYRLAVAGRDEVAMQILAKEALRQRDLYVRKIEEMRHVQMDYTVGGDN